MVRCVLGAVSVVSFCHIVNADSIVFRDSFESPKSAADWHIERGYAIRKGVGVDGSGGVVWEESKSRPKPKTVEPPRVEDNVVRQFPTDGRTVFRRQFRVEPGVRYTASVKLCGQITNNCAYLFFDWFDTNGVRQAHTDARPTIWKEVGTNGWQTVSLTSQRMPSEAAVAEVYLENYRTTLGRMCYDDFIVTGDGARYVEHLFSSAYRDEASEGVVRFVMPFVLPRNCSREKLSAVFTFVGKDGPFSLKADHILTDRADVSVNVARLAQGMHAVKAELSLAGRRLGASEMTFDHPTALSPRRVRIDSLGRTLVDGKVFFPVGVYVHPKDKKIPYLKRLRGGQFNCVIECAPQVNLLNRLHAAGLMAIPKAPKNEEGLRRTMTQLRDHPALLAWYILDEAPPERALVERPLQKLRRELDPGHPTLAVVNHAEYVGAFVGCCDIVARDPYPLSVNCSFPPGSDRKDLLDVSFWPSLCRYNGYDVMPTWQVPQSFSWSWFRKSGHPELDRFPTPDELRSMSWQSIAGGANGILWYTAHHIFAHAKEDPVKSEEYWKSLEAVATEIQSRMEFLSSDEPPPSVSVSTDLIAARAFAKGGRAGVLLANRTAKEVRGDYRLPGRASSKVMLPPLGVMWLTVEK